MISAINRNLSSINNKYGVCTISKQTMPKYSISNSKSNNIFELIHIDIWDPYLHMMVKAISLLL